MHSILTRLNNGSAFLSSCVMALLVAIALTTFLFNPNLEGDLTISSINVFVRFLILNYGRFYIKILAFHLKHDDTLIENKTSLSLISILPQVCRIFRFFLVRLKYSMSDLTPLFNWNTKQVFLYLEAEYDNVKGVRCQPFVHSQL